MPSLHTEIEIAAEPAKVRSVLLDFASYPEWAKGFITNIDVVLGDKDNLKPGDKLNVKATSASFSPTILKNEADELKWRGSMLGLFVGEHRFQFQPSTSSPGGTHLVQSEEFSGLLGFLAGPTWSIGKQTKQGFENLNAEIKARAEKA